MRANELFLLLMKIKLSCIKLDELIVIENFTVLKFKSNDSICAKDIIAIVIIKMP